MNKVLIGVWVGFGFLAFCVAGWLSAPIGDPLAMPLFLFGCAIAFFCAVVGAILNDD